jgi:hypothetical protein
VEYRHGRAPSPAAQSHASTTQACPPRLVIDSQTCDALRPIVVDVERASGVERERQSRGGTRLAFFLRLTRNVSKR